MTEAELQKLVEAIAVKYFNQPFRHQVKINYRMTTTGGRYRLKDHQIEINAHFLIPQYRHELIGIIKHELTHYFLHLSGRGYRHRDQDFKQLLNQVGGSRFAPDIGLSKKQQRKYLYSCQKCGQEYRRVRQINVRRYSCGKCGGKLKLVKKLVH
ncbi:SprT family protein [Lactobacillus sp. ESL0701]|uniref:SprT family protein n=1 Tax=Lactobacillus sp. ESL0701 TaxID=2983217 RepID=UPI0023F92E63|nr:SprT family protein [Lactobacillus sp. ESL0701]MDF7672268.1 SprT family protein [Lactobacillus sp. ESL0701]